jgi:hypothetical protein
VCPHARVTCVSRGRLLLLCQGSCGIGAWQTNSETVHWVSSTPSTGPWHRKAISLPAQATCASTALAPNGSVILALFGGLHSSPKQRIPANYPRGDPINHQFCRNGSTPCGFSKHGCIKAGQPNNVDRPYHDAWQQAGGSSQAGGAAPVHAAGAAGSKLPDCAHCRGTQCQATGCSFPMYVSDGLDGPWRVIQPAMDVQTALNPLNFTGSFSIAGPWIAANGTTTIILQTGDFNDVYPEELRKNNVGILWLFPPRGVTELY